MWVFTDFAQSINGTLKENFQTYFDVSLIVIFAWLIQLSDAISYTRSATLAQSSPIRVWTSIGTFLIFLEKSTQSGSDDIVSFSWSIWYGASAGIESAPNLLLYSSHGNIGRTPKPSKDAQVLRYSLISVRTWHITSCTLVQSSISCILFSSGTDTPPYQWDPKVSILFSGFTRSRFKTRTDIY